MGFGTGTAGSLRTPGAVFSGKRHADVVRPVGVLKRIPAGSVMALRTAGTAGSPGTRQPLQPLRPVDVVRPAGTIPDRAHQAHPVLGFTLDEQIRCHLPGIGEMCLRRTTSRDSRPLNRSRAP